MSADLENFDDLLAHIDRGRLSTSSHLVASRLLRSLGLNDPLHQIVLSLHDRNGSPADMIEVRNCLWSRIDASEPGSDGWLRLAVVLTQPDDIVDGHLAQYFELWARQQGISERQIIAAFQCG